jgi:hypothetical protein
VYGRDGMVCVWMRMDVMRLQGHVVGIVCVWM